MIVAVLTVDLAIFDAQTLKDKRRAIRSLKDRIRNQFNVSVSEIAYQNVAKRCQLAIAMVACESRPVHSQFDQIVELVRRAPAVSLIDYQREFL